MSPNQDLEYVLSVETPHYGSIALLLSDGGRQLDLSRDEDPLIYKLLGDEAQSGTGTDSNIVGDIYEIQPDWQIPLHGEWKNISDVIEQFYSQDIDANEEYDLRQDFSSKYRNSAIAGLGFGLALVPFTFGDVIQNSLDISKTLYYTIAGIVSSVVIIGDILYTRNLFANLLAIYKQGIEAYQGLDKMNQELENIRQGIIRAGILGGMFPPEYGLPK